MIKSEAAWIRQQLEQVGARRILNVGSSTRHFREVEQPWIAECLRGFGVVHADAKDADGVDLVWDSTRPCPYACDCDAVLLTSVLEHAEDRAAVACNVAALGAPTVIVTVPCEWPYHPDPIDNGYRPNLGDLARDCESWMPGYECVDWEECQDERGSCSAVVMRRKTNT